MTPEWLLRVLRRAGIGRPSLAVGQVWRYATRVGEESSRLQIVRIDNDPKAGEVVHIAITGLRIRNPDPSHDAITTISHVPVSRDALERSGLALEAKSGAPPDFEEGYRMWRQEFDAGNAGVFTIPVAEIVDVMEKAFNEGTPS